jgi:hypothetical protein
MERGKLFLALLSYTLVALGLQILDTVAIYYKLPSGAFIFPVKIPLTYDYLLVNLSQF